MGKTVDMQPWLDCFGMLAEYERKGFLQTEPKQHEAYVTLPALHAMSDGDDPARQLTDGSVTDTALRILAYAGWLSREGKGYLKENFAVHVVDEKEPHDLLYTLLITYVRSFWRRLVSAYGDHAVQVIDYRQP